MEAARTKDSGWKTTTQPPDLEIGKCVSLSKDHVRLLFPISSLILFKTGRSS
jgi:hypothetical protein